MNRRFLIGSETSDPHVRIERFGRNDYLIVSPDGSKDTIWRGPDGRQERGIPLSRSELWALAINLLEVLRSEEDAK